MTLKKRRYRYKYGLQELAALLGMTYEATQRAVHRGQIDPTSLEGVVRAWEARRGALHSAQAVSNTERAPLAPESE